jgi:endothelin-converting enzyme/putative endopeptidase
MRTGRGARDLGWRQRTSIAKAMIGLRALNLLVCFVLFCAGCNSGVPRRASSRAMTSIKGPRPAPGLEFLADVEPAIDPRRDPCDDFYTYACGRWIDRLEVPSTFNVWQRGASEVRDHIDRALLDELQRDDPSPIAGMLQARGLFQTCMQGSPAPADGSFAALLAEIDAANDVDAFAALLGKLHRLRVPAFFAVGVQPRWDEPQREVVTFQQAPAPRIRLEHATDRATKPLYDWYLSSIAVLFQRTGMPAEQAEFAARDMVGMEMFLAGAQRYPEIPENPEGVYGIVDRRGLERDVPTISWGSYLAGLGHPDVDEFQLTNAQYLQAAGRAIRDTAPATTRAYLRWRLLIAMADFVSDEVAALRDRATFVSRDWLLLDPHSLRCLRVVYALASEPLVAAYAARVFTGNQVEAAGMLYQALHRAFEDKVGKATWLSATSRQQALAKLHALHPQIGMPPDPPFAESPVALSSDLFGTASAILGASVDDYIARAAAPGARHRWPISPLEVNAFYFPSMNAAFVPMGILHPPFFSVDGVPELNFASLGFVLAHELAHVVFVPGRFYGPEGAIADWWDAASVEAFATRRACINEFFLTYDSRLDLDRIFAENLADIVGLQTAHAALRNRAAARASYGRFSPDQLFFIGFAQTWCQRSDEFTDEMLRMIDTHAPVRARVNSAVAQMPEFARAFSCRPNAPMNPPVRCEPW